MKHAYVQVKQKKKQGWTVSKLKVKQVFWHLILDFYREDKAGDILKVMREDKVMRDKIVVDEDPRVQVHVRASWGSISGGSHSRAVGCP